MCRKKKWLHNFTTKKPNAANFDIKLKPVVSSRRILPQFLHWTCIGHVMIDDNRPPRNSEILVKKIKIL